ncbi:MAG: hypothetical protein E7290_01035 [Lachnospiraceae bacterium]|nr:hypothetical protein [Lachnospiraceae bacterium]
MDLYDNMSAYKVNSVSDTANKDSMLDGKNLLFMTGFCAGMLFFYLAGESFGKEAGKMFLDTLLQMQRMEPAVQGLFWYILECRTRQALLLGILATGKISKAAFYIVITLAGFVTGVFMLLAAYQLGFLGILVSVGMVFPQMILYFKVFKLMFEEHYYGLSGNTNNYHKNNVITSDGWHKIRLAVWKILRCIAYVLVGVMLETYINTWLMKKILLFL